MLHLKNVSLLCVFVFFANSAVNAQNCITPRSEPGDCILLTECPSIINILQQRPISVENANYLKQAGCGFQGLDSKVCCPLEVQSTTTTTTRPPQRNTVDIKENDLLPSTRVCGISNENRILGGTVADLEDYPWMALIEYKTRTGSGFYCGGVLINDRYVLTASHCVNGKDLPTTWKLISVRLGEYNTSSPIDCVKSGKYEKCAPMPQDIPVEQQIPHELYDPRSLDQYHDIALLRLSRSVQYNEFVSPVCLPTTDVHLRSSFEDQTLDVAGWGKTENKSASDVKLKLRVEVQTNADCGSVYSAARITLGEGQMCAGGKRGQDSCRGDSGGPLMGGLVNGPAINTYVLGVVSFGPTPCGMEGWPGVYTRVNKYVPWIKNQLRP